MVLRGALAVLHWAVGTDARNTESVLGSVPTLKERHLTRAELEAMDPQTTEGLVKGYNFLRRSVKL